jgi:inner membrane protease subunit 2
MPPFPLPASIQTPLKYTYLTFLTAGTLAFINQSLLEVHFVTGSSMSPTLSPAHHTQGARDLILSIKRNIRGNHPLEHVRMDIHRGDIVTFYKPHEPENGGSVKRVVAVAGDTVVRDVRRVGRERENEGKTARRMGMGDLGPLVKVPVGHVWVEGDNWRDSLDSNDFGPVSLSLVTGRVDRVVWPPGRMGRVSGILESRDASRTKFLQGRAMLPPSWEA